MEFKRSDMTSDRMAERVNRRTWGFDLGYPSHRTLFVSALLFGVVAITYLTVAPNYEWKEQLNTIPYGGDFLQEWVAGRMILNGQGTDLYSSDFQDLQHDRNLIGFTWDSTQFFPAVYPPSHYLLFSPFAFLTYRWGVVLWLFVLFAAAWGTGYCILKLDTFQSPSAEKEKAYPGLATWIGILMFPTLLISITLGQKSALWMFVISISIWLMTRRHEFTAGLVFGLLSIKPTLFFLIPIAMLFDRRMSFVVGVAISAATLFAATLIFLPLQTWWSFFEQSSHAATYAESNGYRIEWACNLLSVAYTVPLNMIEIVKWGFCLPIGAYLLFATFTDRRDWSDPQKWLLLLSATALLSPHYYHYDLCVIVVPIMWLGKKEPTKAFAYFALIAVGLALSEESLRLLHVPLLPILLIGMVVELRLERELWLKWNSWSNSRVA